MEQKPAEGVSVSAATREFTVAALSAQRSAAMGSVAEVLIIEDEPLIAMDLERIVATVGHRVQGVVRTARDAVAHARQRMPDLVLCDIHLADGTSGLSACHEIMAETGASVVFITAYPERLLTCDRPSSTLMLTKPFAADEVIRVIHKALSLRAAALKPGS